jgi:hypothetical protein
MLDKMGLCDSCQELPAQEDSEYCDRCEQEAGAEALEFAYGPDDDSEREFDY